MAGGRPGRRGVVLMLFAALMLAVGSFLVWQGLDRADKWSSILGAFLNLAAIALALVQAPKMRKAPPHPRPAGASDVTNTISGIVGGSAIQARDIHLGFDSRKPAEPEGDAESGKEEIP